MGGGGGVQQGGGGGGGGQGGQPGGMPDMEQITTALNNMSTAFTGFVDRLNALANTFSGLTVTHNIILGGQVNVAGVDGPELQKAVEKYANNMIQKQLASNGRNQGQTKLGG
jgi:hypothetical protein